MKTKIKELRKANKLSQEELAKAVGTTRQTITSIEVGKYIASLPLAYKIANYDRLYTNTEKTNILDARFYGNRFCYNHAGVAKRIYGKCRFPPYTTVYLSQKFPNRFSNQYRSN